MMSTLFFFHGKPFEDPYQHVYEYSHGFEIHEVYNISTDVMKMNSFWKHSKIEPKIGF